MEFLSVVRSMADGLRETCRAFWMSIPTQMGFSRYSRSEGMMLTIKYTCESKIPFLGICLGFQLAVVEWARNVLDLPSAMSGKFDMEAKHPIVIFMPNISCTDMGSTMHLGLRPTMFEEGSETWSKARALYGGIDTGTK